jgi:hypothetical protein
MTLNGQLLEASAGYRRHYEQAEKFRLDRDKLIAKALKKGWTHAQIAEATGLTRGRIGQIATSGVYLALNREKRS